MHVEEHVPLRELTTLKIGGTARFFCSVSTTHDLGEAVSFATSKKLPMVVLGGGSNVLITGTEFSGLLIKIDIKGVEWEEGGETTTVIAGAGESWDGLVAAAVKRGLWGIENLSGIPGTVGAAPIQNIGAYGTEIKETVEWVEVFDTRTGKTRRFSNKECQFGYRDSLFKSSEGRSLIVTRVAFRLSKNGKPNLEYKDLKNHFAASGLSPSSEGENERGGAHSMNSRSGGLSSKEGGREEPTLSEIRAAVIVIRSKKFPDLNEFGTAGSFFKNPIVSKEKFDDLKKKYPDLPGFELKVPAKGGSASGGNGPAYAEASAGRQKSMVKIPLAWILDNICGLKGYEKGNVKLFEKQPIVLVQNGLASAKEVEAFAKEVARIVKQKTGISIEWEVQHIR